MKRYRSLNMNGDVVAKVGIVKLHVASVASFLVKHINIIINKLYYFNHSLYMYAFVWIGSLLFWLTCLLLCIFCCSPTIPEMMKKDVQQKFKPRVFKISTYEFILWSSQKFLVTILFSRWMIMDSKYYGYALLLLLFWPDHNADKMINWLKTCYQDYSRSSKLNKLFSIGRQRFESYLCLSLCLIFTKYII